MYSKNLLVGRIIHISKTFESYNGVNLNNRFMCIIGIEQDNILMLPMSTFHDEEHKKKKLSYKTNFEYSISHGNTKNGYIKCDQVYCLLIEDLNKFSEEIQLKHKIKTEHFLRLIAHIQKLKEVDKITWEIRFKDQITLDNQKILTDDEIELEK